MALDEVWIIEKRDKDGGDYWWPYDVAETEAEAKRSIERIDFSKSLYYEYRCRRFVAAEG
jgi:hypothetical protein